MDDIPNHTQTEFIHLVMSICKDKGISLLQCEKANFIVGLSCKVNDIDIAKVMCSQGIQNVNIIPEEPSVDKDT